MLATKSFGVTKHKKYKIVVPNVWPKKWKNYDGFCDPPTNKNPKVYIKKSLSNKRKIIIYAHELAHAFFWDEPEQKIEKYAETLIKILDKEGFLNAS